MANRSAESRKVLRELDKQLAALSERTGMKWAWEPQDEAVLTLIADQIDRKVELSGAYAQAVDAKDRTRLSAEIRLLENSVARLLKQVHVDEPGPPPTYAQVQASKHARTAAMKRWHPGWTPGAAG
jgi:hypothetical protein